MSALLSGSRSLHLSIKGKLCKNHISEKQVDPVRDPCTVRGTNEIPFIKAMEKVSNGVDAERLHSYNLVVFLSVIKR